MNPSTGETKFAGSIPQVYERHMVPLFFEHYAIDLATRAALYQPSRLLEIAAGTGVVTRELAKVSPLSTSVVATDLSQAMLDMGASIGTSQPVEWRQADATQLPFPDASFDMVVCQFGVMFFPDKTKAFSEVRRVLRADGKFIFNVWDRIEENEFAHTVDQALATLFPADPPRFMARVPHGYYDQSVMTRDLAHGGFGSTPEFNTVTARSRANSPNIPAIAICQGTPLRSEIEVRGPLRLAEATDIATSAIRNRFGSGAVDGKMQAHIVISQ